MVWVRSGQKAKSGNGLGTVRTKSKVGEWSGQTSLGRFIQNTQPHDTSCQISCELYRTRPTSLTFLLSRSFLAVSHSEH